MLVLLLRFHGRDMPMKPSRIFLSSSFPVAVPALFGAAESGACSSSDAGGEPRSSNKAGTATGKLDDKKILDGFIGMSLPWNRR